MNKEYRWPEGDKLNRKRDADILLRFIKGKLRQKENAGLQKSYVVNLDSEWGSGKTFFLTELKSYLKSLGHVAVYIDAWKDDHSNDPFAAVATEINGELRRVIEENQPSAVVAKVVDPLAKSTMRVVGAGLKSAALHVFEKKLGKEAVDLVRSLGDLEGSDQAEVEEGIGEFFEGAIEAVGSATLTTFQQAKSARDDFSRNLSVMSRKVVELNNIEAPIFVLIDELDRCRPDYAVELLESVKHLFYVDNFVFILATNTDQLAHAVRGVYGQGFDGRGYLSRFIDRTYCFQDVGVEDFVAHSLQVNGLSGELFSVPGDKSAVEFLSGVFKYFDVSLRCIEQLLDYVATFMAAWDVSEVPVNLLLVVDLAMKHHPEDIFGPDKVGDHEVPLFDFRNYQEAGAWASYSFAKMLRTFNQQNMRYREEADSRDEFLRWARDLTETEMRYRYAVAADKTAVSRRGLGVEYVRVFNEMEGVRDVLSSF